MNQLGLEKEMPIRTGNDVWIETRIIIFLDVVTGDHYTIAIGIAVTREVLDYAIAGGAPAKIIRMRNEGKS